MLINFIGSALNKKIDQPSLIFVALPVALFLIFSSPAQAQLAAGATLTPAEIAQESLRRQEQRTREQQQQLLPKADVLQPSTETAISTELAPETPCFQIQSISVETGSYWNFGALASAATPFLKRCIGVQGLRKIAAALDARLIAMGYVTTRVSLPKQNLSEGKLSFFLHEGRIEQIVMQKPDAQNNQPDERWGTWKNAFPIAEGKLLNIRDLEQGVEQMKRLPSQTVSTKIEPGREPDTSIVRIERRAGDFKERLRGGVTVDNSGSEALGRAQLSGYLSLDNLAGLNDIFSLSSNINAQQPNPTHRSYGVSASYNIPFGYHSLNFSMNSSRFAQYVQGTTARFLSSGSSNGADVKWNFLAWRSASAKAGVYAGTSTRRAESFLDDVELVVQRRRTSAFEAGLTYKQFVGQGTVDADLGYRMGMPWNQAQDDLPGAATGGVTLRPRIFSFSGALNQPFKLFEKNIQYSASLRAQFTRDATLSIDQISIGGRGSVRGFDGDSVLLAESGVIVRNEFSSALPVIAQLQSNMFVALDFGRVSGASAANLVGKTLAGVALGTRGSWHGWLFDFSLATRLSKPEKFRTRRFNPYLAMTYAL